MQTEATSTLAEGTVGAAAPHLSQGEQVMRILRGESAAPEQPAGVPDSAEPAAAPREREPVTIKAIAEKFGVEPADLYRELKLSIGDGEELSLEDVKARHKDIAKLDAERISVVRQRGELEADRIAQQRELAKLRAATPAERVDPSMAQAYERYAAENRSREHEALLRAIPEWADKGVITADRKAMQDYLRDTGGWPAESIDHIEDHRLFRTLRQAVQDRKELLALKAEKAAAGQPKPKVGVAPRGGSSQTPGQKLGVLKAAVTKGTLTQTAAVDRILQGR